MINTFIVIYFQVSVIGIALFNAMTVHAFLDIHYVTDIETAQENTMRMNNTDVVR